MRGEPLADGVEFQSRLFLRRIPGTHVLHQLLGHGLLRRRGQHVQLIARVVIGNFCGGEEGLEGGKHRLRIGRLNGVVGQNQGLAGRRRRRLGLRNRLDQGLHRSHDARRLGHLHLGRGRHRHDLPVGPQQRGDFLDHRVNGPPSDRETHGHHLELAAAVQLVERYLGHHPFRQATLEIDHQQHPPPAYQRVALRLQHAVQQIDGFGRSIFAGIGVIEGARRRSIEHE